MREYFVISARLVIIFSLLVFGQIVTSSIAETRTERRDLVEVFEQMGVAGTFVLYDRSKDHFTIINPVRAAKRLYPASTFKIANSLIALETKAVSDAREIIPYGGKPQLFKSWEKDMSLRDAIKISNVPVYQELARRIGVEHYNKWLRKLKYGNYQVGEDVETFWLKGPLKISAIEQTRFLSRLASRTLLLSQRSQTIVSEITELSRTRTRTLHGKTGWSSENSPQLGWFVGWVNEENGIFAFALNIDIHSKADAKKRKPLTIALLKKFGVL